MTTTKVDFGSVPPGIVDDPSWDSRRPALRRDPARRARRVSLARYDAYGSASDEPRRQRFACTGFDVEQPETPSPTEIDANGYLWLATRTGSFDRTS